MEFETVADNAPAIIGARGLEDIAQCIRYIARSTVFSVPLDRSFATTGSDVDSPLPQATAARLATLIEAIEKYEPRVRVSSIRFMPEAGAALDGRLTPIIRFRVREGVSV